MIILHNGTIILDGACVKESDTVRFLSGKARCGRFMKRKPRQQIKGLNVEDSSDEERVNPKEAVIGVQLASEEELEIETDLRYILTAEEAVYCLYRYPTEMTELNIDWKNHFGIFIQPFQSLIHRAFVYKYYKNLGWTVRNGCKFGCDFLLYKRSPETDHSVYTVQVVDKDWNFDCLEVLAACRTSKQVKKTALYIVTPENVSGSIDEYIDDSWRPTEFTLARWKPI